jgi:hypothetical protein
LSGRPELTESEDRIAGSLEHISRDNLRIVRGSKRSMPCWILLSKPFLRVCQSHRATPSPRQSPELRTVTNG